MRRFTLRSAQFCCARLVLRCVPFDSVAFSRYCFSGSEVLTPAQDEADAVVAGVPGTQAVGGVHQGVAQADGVVPVRMVMDLGQETPVEAERPALGGEVPVVDEGASGAVQGDGGLAAPGTFPADHQGGTGAPGVAVPADAVLGGVAGGPGQSPAFMPGQGAFLMELPEAVDGVVVDLPVFEHAVAEILHLDLGAGGADNLGAEIIAGSRLHCHGRSQGQRDRKDGGQGCGDCRRHYVGKQFLLHKNHLFPSVYSFIGTVTNRVGGKGPEWGMQYSLMHKRDIK